MRQLLEMLLGMLVSLFHGRMEVMKGVSLMHGYENGKHQGYGNERKFFLWCVFLLFKG